MIPFSKWVIIVHDSGNVFTLDQSGPVANIGPQWLLTPNASQTVVPQHVGVHTWGSDKLLQVYRTAKNVKL